MAGRRPPIHPIPFFYSFLLMLYTFSSWLINNDISVSFSLRSFHSLDLMQQGLRAKVVNE